MIAIRGATSIDYDEPHHLSERVIELYDSIIVENPFLQVVAVLFSVTPDIRSASPATIIRLRYNLTTTALMCFQEAMFTNSISHIIRVLVLGEGTSAQKFIYLHTASKLREDILCDLAKVVYF